MLKLPTAIAPYASLIKWALIGIIMSSVFIGGCRHGENKSAEKIAKKDQLIVGITHSLNGASKVFKKIEDEAKRRVAADKKAKTDALKAGEVAAKEKQAMNKRIADFEIKIKKAKRKPDCAALLAMDLEAVCGL